MAMLGPYVVSGHIIAYHPNCLSNKVDKVFTTH